MKVSFGDLGIVFVAALAAVFAYASWEADMEEQRAEEARERAVIDRKIQQVSSDLKAIRQPLIERHGEEIGVKVDSLLAQIESVEKELANSSPSSGF